MKDAVSPTNYKNYNILNSRYRDVKHQDHYLYQTQFISFISLFNQLTECFKHSISALKIDTYDYWFSFLPVFRETLEGSTGSM